VGNVEVGCQLSLRISKVDETKVRISGENAELMDLQDYFTFDDPAARFSPKFKHKIWNGKIKLFVANRESLGAGLVPKAIKFLRSVDHDVTVDPAVTEMYKRPEYNEIKLTEFIDSLDVRDENGEELEAFDHQLEPIHQIAKSGRMTLLSPTSSGKSLIIYYLSRWFLHKFPTSRILIIVPTVMLVEQMAGDFATYSAQDPTFQAEAEVHKIYSGQDKRVAARIIVSTWQSLVDLKAGWFEHFETVMIDECHLAAGKSIQSICSRLTNATKRIGFTGTIGNESKTNPLIIESALGPIRKFVTTKQLMDKGIVALLKIRCMVLRHPADDLQLLPGNTYNEERVFINHSARRTRWISGLIRALPGNTLVLFTNKDHGRNLHEEGLKAMADLDRRIFLRTGDDSMESRLEVKPYVETELGVVVYATYGILSTGVSWRNIDHIVFAGPTKGKIRVLQSIGRGLRISGRKWKVGLWDLSDDLLYHREKKPKKKNHGIRHLITRVMIYEEEQFDYRMEKHDI
jgi:superfamily II DNA or RNA helicase